MTEEKSYYTYMVRCSDNSLYTGFTTDLSHRVSVHNRGKVCPLHPFPPSGVSGVVPEIFIGT